MVVLAIASQAQEKANQALAGFSNALQDITAELQNAQNQVQYWKLEADAWKCRYEQERCRNERLRRVLRCIPNKDSCCFLPAQPSILKTSQPLSPRTSAQQLQQQQQHRLHRHSVPLLPTLDELKTDLRFSSSPNVTAAPEGLAPAGPVAADLALPSSDDQKGPLAAATAAVQDGPARDRSLASLSHDGVIRPIQATAVSCVAAAAAGIGGTRELSRQQRQQQLDPFSSYSSQDLEQAADDLSDIQLQQQQHDRQPIAGHYNGLTATLSATASPTAAAAAADRSDRRFPPPFRRSATLPRNWEQFTAEVGKSFTAGDMNLLRAGGPLMPMPGSSGKSKHTIDQLLRMMMAFQIMQGGVGSSAELGLDSTEEEPLQSVSLDDDDGTSGVGLAAAAAVSAAMARAWASAASKEQRAVAAAAASGNGGWGCGDSAGASQRAGFRLVATVTNKMGKRAPSSAALSSVDSLDNNGSSGSSADLTNLGHQQQQQHSPLSRLPATSDTDNPAAAAAAKPPVPPASPSHSNSSSSKQPAAASAAASNSSNSAAPSCGQATAISLQWLSRPRTVLVMRKLASSVDGAFNKALEWLRRHHITIFVEPQMFQELVDSGRVQQHSSSSSSALGKASGSSNSITGVLIDSANGSGSSSLLGTLVTDHDGSSGAAVGVNSKGLINTPSWPTTSRYSSSSNTALIKTWQPELLINQEQQQQDGSSSSSVKASDLIPECVAQQLDLVIVLGGDGTVLWTCHIFGNRSVPPLVPFNLGSLGFLTPFDPAKIETVLHKALRGGFPITLRHRLHATIVRRANTPCAPSNSRFASSSGSGDDCMPAVSRNCLGAALYGEEHVALNEVVIERGISPFLTNLECFCDGGFVTHVQGDGLIIGTPTGSTAYSLAAGGSMVHPQVPCILFTPICPHSLSFRPLMFPDYCQLCIQVPVDSRGHVWASFDGKDRTELVPGDAVVIRLSRWPVPSVAAEADPSGDWFSAVRECLHWNLRKVQGAAGG